MYELNSLIDEIVKVCVIPFLAIIVSYVSRYLKFKANEIENRIENDRKKELFNKLCKITETAVLATYQTYVHTLKDKDLFDKASQVEALNRTKIFILENVRNSELSVFIKELSEDLIDNLIESKIAELKNKLNS